MSKAQQADSISHDDAGSKDTHHFTLTEEGIEAMDIVHRHIESQIAEYRLQIEDDGWEIRVVDPSNVAMWDIEVPATMFSTFKPQGDADQLGIDQGRFSDLLQKTEKKAEITVGHNEEFEPQLIINDEPMALIDPDSIRRPPDVPDLDLPVECTLTDMELVKHYVENAAADHIQISASDEGVAFGSDGEFSTNHLRLPNGNGCEDCHVRNDGNLSLPEGVKEFHATNKRNDVTGSLFSQDYLENFFGNLLKKQRDCDYRMELGDTFPVKFHRQTDSDLKITHMLAPRIQSE